jgi:hypothetical protein
MQKHDFDYFAALYRQAGERRREAQARWQERQRPRWHPPPPEDDENEEPAA